METKTINSNNWSGKEVTANIIKRDNNVDQHETGTDNTSTITFEVYQMKFNLVSTGNQTERKYHLYEMYTEYPLAEGFTFENGEVVMVHPMGMHRTATGEDAALDASIELICNVY